MKLYISARKVSVPRSCACCGLEPDAELEVSYTRTSGKRVVREQTRSWSFPYCRRCIEHTRAWNTVGARAGATIVLGIVLGIVLAALVSEAAVATIPFVVSLPIALVVAARQRGKVRAGLSDSCASAGAAVAYLGWDGSVQGFDFTSRDFTARFAESNGRSLVNVSAELRMLLEAPPARVHASRVPASIAPPGTAVKAEPEEPRPGAHRALEWIAQIESYKGPVARKNALMRALAEVTEPSARQMLVLAASKIEVTAVLDKVDTLTTPAAKRRHLEKAIADLAADDIPDDLQVEEQRLLHEALRIL